ncbi:MAG: methanogenesis marker 5 protein [Candidatus Hadarchaeales archaeon]
MKVFIFPPNSLILSDLVERFGPTPLSLGKEIGERVRDPGLDNPPLNLTEEDLVRGLRYVSIEAPSGVRGRMGVLGPLVDQAEAAVVVKNTSYAFGCSGCARAGLQVLYLLKRRGIPVLEVEYPNTREEAREMVRRIAEFLGGLKG